MFLLLPSRLIARFEKIAIRYANGSCGNKSRPSLPVERDSKEERSLTCVHGHRVPSIALALGVQGCRGHGLALQTFTVSRELALIIQLTLIILWNRHYSLSKEAQGTSN